MAPQEKVELVILKLTFLPYVHPLSPRIFLTRKRYLASGSMAHVRDWYDRTMFREKAKIPLHLKVGYCEWNITSGNVDIFTIHGFRYDKILLILGDQIIHWVYYQNMPMQKRLEGCGPLNVNYCNCCLQNQYMKLLDNVKGCIINDLEK